MSAIVETQNLDEPTVATVRGQTLTELPHDLYIPPHALEVFLEAFEGPLDLLLYLIKRQNFNILDIPIAEVTRQYIAYIDLMQDLKLELAAEYLVMAAMLAEIKSRLLLPKPATLVAEEADPRAELIRRLQEYEQIKQAAEQLDALPQRGRDVFAVTLQPIEWPAAPLLPSLTLNELTRALQALLQRTALVAHHAIKLESLSVRERMSQILLALGREKSTNFINLITVSEGKVGVVVTFIAVLELVKQTMIELVQIQPYALLQLNLKQTVPVNDATS